MAKWQIIRQKKEKKNKQKPKTLPVNSKGKLPVFSNKFPVTKDQEDVNYCATGKRVWGHPHIQANN